MWKMLFSTEALDRAKSRDKTGKSRREKDNHSRTLSREDSIVIGEFVVAVYLA